MLFWDNLNIHLSGVMKRLIAVRRWLTVYQLPAYARELTKEFLAKIGLDFKPP